MTKGALDTALSGPVGNNLAGVGSPLLCPLLCTSYSVTKSLHEVRSTEYLRSTYPAPTYLQQLSRRTEVLWILYGVQSTTEYGVYSLQYSYLIAAVTSFTVPPSEVASQRLLYTKYVLRTVVHRVSSLRIRISAMASP